MTEGSKREWVFNGTRGEFWTFLIVTAVYFVFLIRTVVHPLDGVVRHTKVDRSTSYSLEEFSVLSLAFVGFFILTIAFRVFGRWFTVAFAFKTVETAAKIVLAYGNVSGPYALGALVVLDFTSTLLLFIAFLSYIVSRLKRETWNQATESDLG